MSIDALPDLNVLPAEALRTMLVTTHEQLRSTTDKLAVAQEQLQSREQEIEHLQLLLAKLHRMQFGRKSEKLARQIEQLELRVEDLQQAQAGEPRAHSVESPAREPFRPLPRRNRLVVHCRSTCQEKPRRICRNIPLVQTAVGSCAS
jgi:predicted RecB family endonuclease